MSEIVEDPGSLTKERLKNELITHNVVLPPGDQRKHVYIELYTQFVMPTARKSRARTRAEFSSDEEEEPSRTRVTRSAKKSYQKKTVVEEDPQNSEKDVSVLSHNLKAQDPQNNAKDLSALSDTALHELLDQQGVFSGPITASTRKVLENKLKDVMNEDSPLKTDFEKNNSSGHSEVSLKETLFDGYSDTDEEEDDAEAKKKNENKQPQMNSIQKTLTVQSRITTTNKEKMREPAESAVKTPVEPSKVLTPFANFSATRRKPLHGQHSSETREAVSETRKTSRYREIARSGFSQPKVQSEAYSRLSPSGVPEKSFRLVCRSVLFCFLLLLALVGIGALIYFYLEI